MLADETFGWHRREKTKQGLRSKKVSVVDVVVDVNRKFSLGQNAFLANPGIKLVASDCFADLSVATMQNKENK